jgi:ADP-ribosylglycohydrolase
MARTITDRVYGCLVGGAIGDALGATVENWSYDRIREEYGKVETFRAYDNPHARGEPGTVTDDTVMRHYLCLAIAERGGRVTPDEYAAVLREYLNPERVWVTEEIMLRKLAAGINPWEAGRGNIPTGTATMSIAPVGIVNAANPRQAYQDGFTIASVNQDGANRAAAATVAAAVAEALSPDASVDSVIEVMRERSSDTVFRALDLALGLADESDTVDEFVERFYDRLLDWQWPAVEWNREMYYEGRVFSADSLESLPAATGLLALCGEDADRSLVEAASFGRDCDTIASLVGNVVGALHGADEIREEWIDQCEEANAEFFEEVHGTDDVDFETVSEWMVDALETERQRSERRVATLDSFL